MSFYYINAIVDMPQDFHLLKTRNSVVSFQLNTQIIGCYARQDSVLYYLEPYSSESIVYTSESIAQSITTTKYLLWLNFLILVVFFAFLEQKNSVAHCQRVCFPSRRFQDQILESRGGRKKFQGLFSDSKGPTGRRRSSQIMSDSPIAYSRGAPPPRFQRRPH